MLTLLFFIFPASTSTLPRKMHNNHVKYWVHFGKMTDSSWPIRDSFSYYVATCFLLLARLQRLTGNTMSVGVPCNKFSLTWYSNGTKAKVLNIVGFKTCFLFMEFQCDEKSFVSFLCNLPSVSSKSLETMEFSKKR